MEFGLEIVMCIHAVFSLRSPGFNNGLVLWGLKYIYRWIDDEKTLICGQLLSPVRHTAYCLIQIARFVLRAISRFHQSF